MHIVILRLLLVLKSQGRILMFFIKEKRPIFPYYFSIFKNIIEPEFKALKTFPIYSRDTNGQSGNFPEFKFLFIYSKITLESLPGTFLL